MKWFRKLFHVENIKFISIQREPPHDHSFIRRAIDSLWFIKNHLIFDAVQIAVNILENWGFCLRLTINSFTLQ